MSHVDEGTLHAYLDGELPRAETTALEAHAAECATCRARLADERALIDRATAVLGLARPVERSAPPLQQIGAGRRRLVQRVRLSLAWAASLVLAVGLGYYLHGTRGSVAPLADAPLAQPASGVVAADRNAAQEAAPQPQARQRGFRRDSGRAPAKTSDNTIALAPQGALEEAEIRAAPRLRASEPEAAAPAQVPAPSASRADDLAALRGRSGTTHWPIISRGVARSLLGTEPVGLPGLAASEIRRSPTPDATVVVEQRLDSSTVIQIFQRSVAAVAGAANAAADSAAPVDLFQRIRRESAADRLARFVGGLRVEIAGPLSQDSLNRLLEQVKPLP